MVIQDNCGIKFFVSSCHNNLLIDSKQSEEKVIKYKRGKRLTKRNWRKRIYNWIKVKALLDGTAIFKFLSVDYKFQKVNSKFHDKYGKF